MKRELAAAAAAGAIMLSLAFGVTTARAEPALPAPVAAAVKENADLCKEVGATANTADAAKRADLSGDGNLDYVFFVGWIHCPGSASLYGDREKAVTVFAGDAAGGAAPAFSGMVYDVKLEGTAPALKLWLTVSGSACGKPPAPDFAHESFCDRALAWNAKSKKFDFAPVATVRMIE
jgi:hypothetical protein